MGRDSEDEKNGESSKRVTLAERITMSVGGITTIALLKSRVSQEDAFRSLGGELVLSRCESMNKTSTAKDMRRKEIKRLGRKKEGMRDLVM